MGFHVVMGSMLQCTFGVAPSTMVVLPSNCCISSNMPAANIMDNKPFVNILPFGMCNSMANPMVIAATAAALGVMTPMPCIPVTAAPWVPGAPTMLLGNMPALNDSSMCMCNWGGVIKPSMAGQFTEMVP
jgi:hypothetical protein